MDIDRSIHWRAFFTVPNGKCFSNPLQKWFSKIQLLVVVGYLFRFFFTVATTLSGGHRLRPLEPKVLVGQLDGGGHLHFPRPRFRYLESLDPIVSVIHWGLVVLLFFRTSSGLEVDRGVKFLQNYKLCVVQNGNMMDNNNLQENKFEWQFFISRL